MKFNYIKIIFSIFIVFILSLAFTSCDSSETFGGVLNVTAKRKSLVVYAEFDEDDRISSCSPYVNLYTINDDGEIEYKDYETLDFASDDDYTETEKVTFDDLDEETEYVLKLFVTYSEESYEVYSINVSTTPSGSTEENPIMVSTYDELVEIADDNEAYYKLNNDIDCNGETLDSLFNSSNIFNGGFDGANYTISNFVLSSNSYIGLFGDAENATIKNLNLDTVSLVSSLSSSGRGETYCGALVGKATNVTIENVHITNVDFDITFTSSAVVTLGGFAGKLIDSNVKDCSLETSTIDVLKARKRVAVGLFAGVADGKTTISSSYSTGSISSVSYFSSADGIYNYVGGFIGASSSIQGEISDCYTIVDITVTEDSSRSSLCSTHSLAVGGFIGSDYQQLFNINNCAAIADITVTTQYSNNAYIGGILGNTSRKSTVKNSIYVPKDAGIKVNVVDESEDEETEAIETEANIYISSAFGTNYDFTKENIYVSSEKINYIETTNTTVISDNYTLYSEAYKDNLSTTIQSVIESYINK